MRNPFSRAVTVGTVASAEYTTYQPGTDAVPQDTLRVRLESGETLRVPNGGWGKQNPALRLMAFLGVSPSTLDEAEGTALPLTATADGGVDVPDFVLDIGGTALDDSEWFSEVTS